jgi:hypothetical protein
MKDTPDQVEDGGDEEFAMTLLAIGESYWLYKGTDLLNDMLFGRGEYPFRVLCLKFRDHFGVNQHFGEAIPVGTFWRINPDVVARLRDDGLLIEIIPSDV